jgi:tRNA (adenine37-N6)-methyltransferase
LSDDKEPTVQLTQIGVIRSPFSRAAGTPVQPCCAPGVEGQIEVFDDFAEGLRDLDGFQRIWVLFWCHRVSKAKLTVVPYRDTVAHGLFATRAPARPNPIGLSTVRLYTITGNLLHVGELDILDGTPLLDIKPYVSQYDSYPAQQCGWLDGDRANKAVMVADNRFESVPADPSKVHPTLRWPI